MTNRNDEYKDVPNYERKISRLRHDLEKLERERRQGGFVGGGLYDHSWAIFDLEKQHVLAQAHSLAKKQHKESVVARLLKSAKIASYPLKPGNPYEFLGTARYHTLSRLKKGGYALAVATFAVSGLTAISAPVTAGVSLAAGALAYYIAHVASKRIDQKSAHYDLKKLKSYVKTGQLR